MESASVEVMVQPTRPVRATPTCARAHAHTYAYTVPVYVHACKASRVGSSQNKSGRVRTCCHVEAGRV